MDAARLLMQPDAPPIAYAGRQGLAYQVRCRAGRSVSPMPTTVRPHRQLDALRRPRRPFLALPVQAVCCTQPVNSTSAFSTVFQTPQLLRE